MYSFLLLQIIQLIFIILLFIPSAKLEEYKRKEPKVGESMDYDCEECDPGFVREKWKISQRCGRCVRDSNVTCDPGFILVRKRQCARCPCPGRNTNNEQRFGTSCRRDEESEIICDCLYPFTGKNCSECEHGAWEDAKKSNLYPDNCVRLNKINAITNFPGLYTNGYTTNSSQMVYEFTTSDPTWESGATAEIGMKLNFLVVTIVVAIAIIFIVIYILYKVNIIKKHSTVNQYSDVSVECGSNQEGMILMYSNLKRTLNTGINETMEFESLAESRTNKNKTLEEEQVVNVKLKNKIQYSIWKSKQPLILVSQKPLGNGSFGKVFKVQHINTKQLLALKVIPLISSMMAMESINLHSNLDFRLLLRETEHLSLLQHPNIVRYYNCWVESPKGSLMDLDNFDGTELSSKQNYNIFVQMELCDGALDDWLERSNQNVNIKESVTNIMTQILKGLQAMHNKNIIHRDIKPNNIFYKEDSIRIWKLGDLGLSRRIGDGSSVLGKLAAVGHAAYMSPEMTKGFDYSYETDIYSLGLVLLQMVVPEIRRNRSKMYDIFLTIKKRDNVDKDLVGLLTEQRKIFDSKNVDKLVLEILKGMLNSSPAQRFSITKILELLQNFIV